MKLKEKRYSICFWCCRIVQSYWKILENWLIKYKILPETKSIDKLTALGLKSEYETPLVSLSTLLARNHIYTNKLSGKEPDFLRYLQLLKQHASFENQALKNTMDIQEKMETAKFFSRYKSVRLVLTLIFLCFFLSPFIALIRIKKNPNFFFHTLNFAYFLYT